MKNNFFAILLSLIISIGCTQETVINANIDEKLNNSGPTLKVQIKTENSRTIRPEVTKWEIKLFESNEQLTTRVLHGKDNTVTTFTNITTTEYKIEVFGYTVEGDKDCKILYGEEVVKITANETKMCVVTVNDNFEAESSENPNGTLSVNISGLGELGIQEDFNFTLKMSGLTNPDNPQTVTLSYKDGVLSGKGSDILSGSYKIQSISFADAEALPTDEEGDSAAIDVLPINLIQDPIVNIYPGTTTYINWTWKYSKEEITQITQNNMLKNTLVPVWNKPVSNRDSPAESSAPAKNGSLSANALFAEPTWDKEESYVFEELKCSYHEETTSESIYNVAIEASKFDFINCAYDESDNLWVLSYCNDEIKTIDENGGEHCFWENKCVLKNLSESEEYHLVSSEEISSDFTVATVGEKKYLFVISNSQIRYAELKEGEIVNIPNGNVLELGIGIDDYNVTALYVKDKKIYIAITVTNSGETGDNYTTANIYTGTISLNGTNNSPKELLSLSISDFIDGTNQDDYSFQSQAFAISDMYINEDKLYVTAGCVNYDGNSWNNNQGGGVYHSFGGLFVYELDEAGNLKKDVDGKIIVNSYGINNNETITIDPETENDIDPNPFLTTGGEGILEVEENIMQAVANDSQYFAGPRYIIPAGKDLLIVDSGFYGVYSGEKKRLIYCEKRNRIFTFDGSTLSAPIKLSDSISFDYDYLVNSDVIE